MFLFFLSALTLTVKIKNFHKAYHYFFDFLAAYRDFTFFLLLVIYIIESFVGNVSYSLLVVPFLLTPLMVYGMEGIFTLRKMSQNPATLSNAAEVENYLYTLLSAVGGDNAAKGHTSSASQCYLLAMANYHAGQCENEDCVCRAIEEESEAGVKVARNDWLLFVKQQLCDAVARFPSEVRLCVFSACFEYYWLDNFLVALEELNKAREMKPSTPQMIVVEYFHSTIEESIITGEISIPNTNSVRSRLNTKEIDRFIRLFNKFMEKLETCMANNITFWTILAGENIDTSQLNAVGNSIFDLMNQIHDLYVKITACDPNNVNFLYKYGVFLRYVIFDEIFASKIFARIKMLKEKIGLRKSNGYGGFVGKINSLVVVKVSGERRRLGKILDVNFEAVTKLKFSKEELLKKCIKDLMPANDKNSYDEWVSKNYYTMSLKDLSKVQHAFIVNKEGYYTFCNYLIMLMPSLKGGLTFVAAFKPNRKLRGYVQPPEAKALPCTLVCDGGGKLLGINRYAGQWMGVAPREVEMNSEVTVNELIPELSVKEKEERIRSPLGYRCVINVTRMSRQLRDADNLVDEDEEQREVPAVVRIMEGTFGSKLDFPRSLQVAVIFPVAGVKGRNEQTDGVLRSSEREENKEAAEVSANLENSVAASANSSTVAERNSLHEFKASLYEKKEPHTVKVLKYTIWMLYLILLVACLLDWIITYKKNSAVARSFDDIQAIAKRFNSLAEAAVDSRTIDDIISRRSTNKYYGDSFYTETNAHVFSALRSSWGRP